MKIDDYCCNLFNNIHILNNEIMPQRLLIAGGTGIATGGQLESHQAQ